MRGIPGFDPALLANVATEFGSRAALVATGDSPAAIAALLKVDLIPHDPASSKSMTDAIHASRDARALLGFALSDAFLNARQSAAELDKG